MRNSTRLRFFLAAASLSTLTALFIACGGSDEQDVTAPPDSGVDTNRPDTSNTTPDTGPADTGPKDAASDVRVYNPGDAAVLEAGPEYDGSIACVAGGQIEQEVNDNPDAANELRTTPDAGCLGFTGPNQTGPGCSRCGVIFDNDLDAGKDAGDGGLGGTELEYLSFVIQPGTKDFFIQFQGDVTLVVTVEGSATEYVITTAGGPALPYAAGKRYFIQVKSNSGAVTPWRVTLYENQ
jgi:hypothetical protein